MAETLPGLVSIIMPAYNGENYIQQAIESVLSQTYSNWELIIVDDGSTDHTAEIVRRYADSRIQSIYQENGGQASALNRGLDLANGEYMTTLDTDDWYTNNSLQDRVDFLNNHPEFGAVYGDGFYCDENGMILKRFSEYRIGNVSGDVYDVLIQTPFFGTGANVMIRREVLENFHIRYDVSIFWCQDLDLYIRVAEKCEFGVVDSLIVWYRIHKANMTMSAPQGRRLESLMRTKHKVLSSPRFELVQIPSKVAFFFQFLTVDLQGQPSDQETVIIERSFLSLPKPEQAKLMRLVGNQYLLGEKTRFAKDWLLRAWRTAPFDVKTLLSVIVANLSPALVKFIVGWWRRSHGHNIVNRSPFEMV